MSHLTPLRSVFLTVKLGLMDTNLLWFECEFPLPSPCPRHMSEGLVSNYCAVWGGFGGLGRWDLTGGSMGESFWWLYQKPHVSASCQPRSEGQTLAHAAASEVICSVHEVKKPWA